MDLKDQIILEYLEQGSGYRKLQQKYGISRTTICKWVQIYQGVHGLERTQKQQNHYLRDMDDAHKKRLPKAAPTAQDLEKKIAALEKQLQWEKLRADALDTMINIAEDKLKISIRKSLATHSPGSKKANSAISLKAICWLLGYSAQAYHKHQNKTMRLHLQQGLMLDQIARIRKLQPRCGGRKLYVELQDFFKQHTIVIGRDKFFDILRKNKLLVRKQKRNVYTTMSKHHFRRYPNLVKDFIPQKAHELWVADITYIPTVHRHAYLFLITDAYSRKIVGFHLSDDMKVSSGIMALKKALAQKPADAIVVHHSDRGIQYCSTAYTNLLQQNNCMISMTENSDPYENAIAERVNGILKTELISNQYSDADTASKHISRCITIYNYKRRHSSLNWQIPADVHLQKGPQIKQWKNYYYKRSKPTENAATI